MGPGVKTSRPRKAGAKIRGSGFLPAKRGLRLLVFPREQLCFVFPACSFRNFGRVVSALRVAADVRETDAFELVHSAAGDLFDLWSKIMPGRQIEPHWTSASATIVAVALP